MYAVLEVVEAEYLGKRQVRIKFNDGKEGVADMTPMLSCEPSKLFSRLNDEAVLKSFSLAHGTLCWEGGLDVAAEYLYYLSFRFDSGLQVLFKRWGYC